MYPRPYGEGWNDPTPPQGHRRQRRRLVTPLAIGVAVAVVLGLGGVGWALLGGSGSETPAGASGPVGDTSTLADDPSDSPSASPSPSRSAKPTPSKTKKPAPKQTTSTKRAAPPPKPKPTSKPPKQNLPPAPPTSTPAVCVTPTKYGTNADDPTVRSALHNAGSRNYWNTGNVPEDLAGQPVPEIDVPDELMWAIAYQESSWRSSVVSCDGGIGLMQVTVNKSLDIDTATWMNDRYGTSYDVTTLDGNVALGAELLEYEVMYFVLNYRFKLPDTPDGQVDFDLDAVAKAGPGGAEVTLRDIVISAYNVGIWNVIQKDGSLKIINPGYVSSVYDFVDNNCEGRCG
jgi:hypothetical protein